MSFLIYYLIIALIIFYSHSCHITWFQIIKIIKIFMHLILNQILNQCNGPDEILPKTFKSFSSYNWIKKILVEKM